MLETSRLILRQWESSDFSPFADLNKDHQVMEFFPNLLTDEESDKMAMKIQSLITKQGWGFWATEEKESGEFIGFVGLHKVRTNLPFYPNVEIGWRLAKKYWQKGYATEAAFASMNYAFEVLNLDQLISFTTVKNIRSQAVMIKLGMSDTNQNFFHPEIEHDNLLSEHVLYKITRSEWLK